MTLPPRQKFGEALRAAGVNCNNPRGWWGGIGDKSLPVVTTWIDAGAGPDRFLIWQPETNHGGLRAEWIVGNIRVGTLVELIMLDQHGDAPLNEGPRRVAGARLMPGLWRVVQMITHTNGMPGAIVERVGTADEQGRVPDTRSAAFAAQVAHDIAAVAALASDDAAMLDAFEGIAAKDLRECG
jgi:hypothetical protein